MTKQTTPPSTEMLTDAIKEHYREEGRQEVIKNPTQFMHLGFGAGR